MTRHAWSSPERYPRKTERFCTRCGLIRITRHEPAHPNERGIRDAQGRLVSIEWWTPHGADGMPARLDRPATPTPPCAPRAVAAATEPEKETA